MSILFGKAHTKKLISFILTALFATALAGCGETVAESDERGPDDIAYRAEYPDIDIAPSFPRSIVARGDFLYFIVGKWLEAEGRTEHNIVKVSLLDGTREEIPLFAWAENEAVNMMAMDAKGNFLILTYVWSENNGVSSHILYEISASGEKISEKDMGELLGLGAGSLIQGFYCGSDDNRYFIANDGTNYQLIVTDAAEQVAGRIGFSDINNFIVSLFCSDDGGVYITTPSPAGGMAVRKADFAVGAMSGDVELAGLGGNYNLRLARGGPSGVLANDGFGLFACDFEENTATKLLDWLDCGLGVDNYQYFGQLSDGSYWVIKETANAQGFTDYQLIILRQTSKAALPPRETVVFVTCSNWLNLTGVILDFNNSQQQYQVEIVNYYNEGNPEAGGLAFQAALTGAEFDLVDLSVVNYVELASKGALLDLNPYFDESGLDRGEYFANILNAYDINGKLYGVMPEFMLQVLVGQESRLGDIADWTATEMIAWAENYPEAKLMNEARAGLMFTMIYSTPDQYIDWESGSVNFASKEFIRTLEFIAGFGNEEDRQIGLHEGFAGGQYLLLLRSVFDLTDMQKTDIIMGGEAKYIGFPKTAGSESGIRIWPVNTVGISARSQHKEGALAFVSYLLSDAYQLTDGVNPRYYIPVKRSGVEALIALQTAEPAGPEGWEGEFPLYSWNEGDLRDVYIYASRNRDYVDTFYDLIARADGLRRYDSNVANIVTEEAGAFFAGQKTAREVAEIIESRVQVYVNEVR